MNPSPLITVAELSKIYKSPDLILIDARNCKNAKESYKNEHLEGAIFIDLDTQLAAIQNDLSKGGRHPLPYNLSSINILPSDLK